MKWYPCISTRRLVTWMSVNSARNSYHPRKLTGISIVSESHETDRTIFEGTRCGSGGAGLEKGGVDTTCRLITTCPRRKPPTRRPWGFRSCFLRNSEFAKVEKLFNKAPGRTVASIASEDTCPCFRSFILYGKYPLKGRSSKLTSICTTSESVRDELGHQHDGQLGILIDMQDGRRQRVA